MTIAYAFAKKGIDVNIYDTEDIRDVDCIIFAVAHDEFKNMSVKDIKKFYSYKNRKILLDVKIIFDKYIFDKKTIYIEIYKII